MNEKLRTLVHREKMSRRELANLLGYKHSDYITHLIRGFRKTPKAKQEIIDRIYEKKAKKIAITVREYIPGSFDRVAYDEYLSGEGMPRDGSADGYTFNVIEVDGTFKDVEKYFKQTDDNVTVIDVFRKEDVATMEKHIDAIYKTRSYNKDKTLANMLYIKNEMENL